jgi:hypothetical protein
MATDLRNLMPQFIETRKKKGGQAKEVYSLLCAVDNKESV